MIVIIGFILMVIFIFRYHYSRISDPECRKNTKDGITYKDAFGQLRLLRNGRKVRYKQDNSGRVRLFYDNNWPVDEFGNYKDAARFNGESDYLCDTWGSGYEGYIFEVFATGERYMKVPLNGRSYYLEYGNGKPLKIVREAQDKHTVPNSKGVDINEFNKVLEEMYRQDPTYYSSFNYCRFAYERYMQRQRIIGR